LADGDVNEFLPKAKSQKPKAIYLSVSTDANCSEAYSPLVSFSWHFTKVSIVY
jgi:hypothetical protein